MAGQGAWEPSKSDRIHSTTPLLVTIARAYKHFGDALDERRPLFDARAREIAKQEIEHERWVQYCQERAIFGPH